MLRTLSTLAVIAALPGLAAATLQDCGTPTDPPTGPIYDNFDDEVDWRYGGCADVSIFARNDADTLGLFFRSQGQVEQVQQAGHELTFELDLSTDAASVRVDSGENVTTLACDDVIIEPPRVEESWQAIGGTAILTIAYDEDGGTFDTSAPASLLLLDVVLVGPDGTEAMMDDFGPAEVIVGWLPG